MSAVTETARAATDAVFERLSRPEALERARQRLGVHTPPPTLTAAEKRAAKTWTAVGGARAGGGR